MDQWICSRLYSTVVQCEEAFEAYELHAVTSALYSFWVHSLCDVYMVRSIYLHNTAHSLMSLKKKGHIRKKVITFVLAVIYLPLSLEIDRINLNKITVVTSLWRCVCHLLLPLSVSYRSTWSLCCSSRMTAADRGRWPAVSSITVCRCLWPCSPLSCPSSLRSCGRESNRSDPDLLPRTTACVYSRIPPPLNW